MDHGKRSRRGKARIAKVAVGVDVHKSAWVVTAVREGEEVFHARIRAEYRGLKQILGRFKGCEVCVAYEAGPCGFGLYDELERDHYRCVVVAPSLVPVQSGNRVKTDRRDSRKLADCLATGLLTPVHVLTPEQRAHRDLLRTRRQQVERRSDIMRQIKAKLLFHSLRVPGWNGRSWSRSFRQSLRRMDYPDAALRASFHSLLDTYEFTSLQIESLTKDAIEMSRSDAYKEAVGILITVPGIGQITAMEILTEMGDMSRFSSNEGFWCFLGLVPSEFTSAEKRRLGGITRCGNRRVRTALVESAWTLIRKDPAMKMKFQRIRNRRGSKRAITAIARNLAGRIRTILLRKESYVVAVG